MACVLQKWRAIKKKRCENENDKKEMMKNDDNI